MRRESQIKYQDGKIRYHNLFVGYYEDMKKNPDISRLTKDEILEQIAYHKQLVKYHQKRKEILARGV